MKHCSLRDRTDVADDCSKMDQYTTCCNRSILVDFPNSHNNFYRLPKKVTGTYNFGIVEHCDLRDTAADVLAENCAIFIPPFCIWGLVGWPCSNFVADISSHFTDCPATGGKNFWRQVWPFSSVLMLSLGLSLIGLGLVDWGFVEDVYTYVYLLDVWSPLDLNF